MIPTSLLLILVAVSLLVLGLTGGSSNLLIGSIAASLLAAVALVVGARQTAAARRTADQSAEPADAEVADPQYAAAQHPAAQFAETEFADPEFADPEFADTESPDAQLPDAQVVDSQFGGTRYSGAQFSDSQFVAEPEFAAAAAAGAEPDSHERRRDQVVSDDFSPGDEDFAAESSRSASPASARHGAQFATAGPEEPGDLSADEARAAGRRDATAAGASDRFAEGDATAAGSSEFAQADGDDPADEPPPQSVHPADAARLARLDAEVLVVDGRPRYHLADCAHLPGRLTEPIGVNEAVELGFSPCGLCRPADRLVAAARR